jgi:putative SOS response-associated peptidase YedK
MCSHYESIKKSTLIEQFAVPDAGISPSLGKTDVWPTYEACMIRRPPTAQAATDSAVPVLEAVPARFGLIPSWASEASFGRRTYNARSETVAEKPSFRQAWRAGQRCIVPAQAIFEPNWSSGRAVSTRITRADGRAMGIAGIWSSWRSPEGAQVLSFSMLTVNAAENAFMCQFHKAADEKRMVVILEEADFSHWLDGTQPEVTELLKCAKFELISG